MAVGNASRDTFTYTFDNLARVIAQLTETFDQPRVADAVSDLFRDVSAFEKIPVQMVIGDASLPLAMPILHSTSFS